MCPANFKHNHQRNNIADSGVGPPHVRVVNHLDNTIYILGKEICDHLRGRECLVVTENSKVNKSGTSCVGLEFWSASILFTLLNAYAECSFTKHENIKKLDIRYNFEIF